MHGLRVDVWGLEGERDVEIESERERERDMRLPGLTLSANSGGKVDIRLPGKGNSKSRGARPVYSFR